MPFGVFLFDVTRGKLVGLNMLCKCAFLCIMPDMFRAPLLQIPKNSKAETWSECSLYSISILAQALWLFELVCTLCGWVLPGTRVTSGTGVRQGRGGIVSFFACLARRGGLHAGTPSSWAVSTPYPFWLKQTCAFPTATR